jgi:hypothetical protein
VNGYKQTKGLQPPEHIKSVEQEGFSEGYRGDADASMIPLDASPALSDVRIEDRAIRRDWGYDEVGTPALRRILGMLDHKYLSGQELIQRIVRISRTTTGQAFVELWNGTIWAPLELSAQQINDSLLSIVSIQGLVVFTNGTEILAFQEEVTETLNGNDFPILSVRLNRTDDIASFTGTVPLATLVPAEAFANAYTVYVYILVWTFSIFDLRFVVTHEGNDIGYRTVRIGGLLDSGIDVFTAFPVLDLAIAADGIIESGDDVTVDIDQITEVTLRLSDYEPDIPYEILDTEEGPVPIIVSQFGQLRNSEIDFYIDSTVVASSITIGVYYSNVGFEPPTWIYVAGEDIVIAASGVDVKYTVTMPDFVFSGTDPTVEPEKVVALKVLAFGDVGNSAQLKKAEWYVNPMIVFRGNSKADGDAHWGVEYSDAATSTTEVDRLSLDAPSATFLLPFGDRLLALRDHRDPQVISWSVDGDIEDWIGIGSGQSFLIDTRADPVDELMAGAVIGQNVAAVFRRRSIMRAFETGNVDQAIGFIQWIDYLGTDAPHAVQGAQGGAIFLGHDRMVYYLTVQGPIAIGKPVQKVFKALSDDRLEWVQARYNPKTGEYSIGMPFADATKATEIWIFELHTFIEEKKIVWRKRNVISECSAIVSATSSVSESAAQHTLFANSGAVYQIKESAITYDGIAFSGRWQSRKLNVDSGFLYHTLNALFLAYETSINTSIKIRYSGDGGVSWTSEDIIPADANGEVVWCRPLITGKDIRFELIFDNSNIRVLGFSAHVVPRSMFNG